MLQCRKLHHSLILFRTILLDNTKMKLNQISLKLGIDDQYYFSRLFSKIMGTSPKAYRERQKA